MNPGNPNPFKPPVSPVTDPANDAPGSPIKAVATGLGIDVGGTIIGSLLLGIVYAAYLASTGLPQPEIQEALADTSSGSGFGLSALAVGCFFSGAGGYACARIARRSEYRLGFVLAGLSILVGLAFRGSAIASEPVETTMGILFTLLSVLAGSHLGRRRRIEERR